MQSDLDIASRATLAPITHIADQMGLDPSLVEPYGRGVAKIDLRAIDELSDRPRARYVVVTAVTPTPLGEGKTTTAVGLGQGFSHVGRRATITLRQPSMGPTFGIKGGAAGGGYSQVVPMDRLNLHLTGDTHAVTAAHDLLAAMVDNHLHHAPASGPDLDPRAVSWGRVLDINDRALRSIVVGLGARIDGVPRQARFDITAASEVMSILSLATSLSDLRARLGRIVVGRTRDGEEVTAEQLKAAGAMAVLLRDALQPNLLQTLEHTPALVHTGPFGNLATGSSSVVADLIGLRTGDVLLTEAGFGADLGAERFLNVKCRQAGLVPDAAVLVVTCRALKVHAGRTTVMAGRPLPPELTAEDPAAVAAGLVNLHAQLEVLRRHGVTPVVALNAFPTDHPSEHAVVLEAAADAGVRAAVTTHVADGGAGAAELAAAVWEASQEPGSFSHLYPDEASIADKLTTIATEIYGADGVDLAPLATRQIAELEAAGHGRLPLCVAKTHLSLSDDPTRPGAPRGWRLPVREVRASVGAGFLTPICGEVRTMPGLGREPAAHRIDLAEDGSIIGLS